MSERKKLVIKESEWGMGRLVNRKSTGDNPRRAAGTKCCLGFYCEQISGEALRWGNDDNESKAYPQNFPEMEFNGFENLPAGIRRHTANELKLVLACINDDEIDLTLDEKKRLITLGFAQIDIDVEFVP